MAQVKELKPLEKVRLIDMMRDDMYNGLADGLCQLPVPDWVKIGRGWGRVPKGLGDFLDNLCYGQRLFFTQKEENDFGIIIRVLDGYFYPLLTFEKWDADEAIKFGKNILLCKVEKIYPTAMHIVTLISEMAEQERKLLHREPSKIEQAAGIERLNRFAELSSLDFLRDQMKVPVSEVLLTPYKECLVRFMMQKETDDYKERYLKLMQEEAKAQIDGKSKKKVLGG